eukprot:RCo040785
MVVTHIGPAFPLAVRRSLKLSRGGLASSPSGQIYSFCFGTVLARLWFSALSMPSVICFAIMWHSHFLSDIAWDFFNRVISRWTLFRLLACSPCFVTCLVGSCLVCFVP